MRAALAPYRVPLVTLAVLLALFAAARIFGAVASREKLADVDLAAKPVDVAIRLDFEPERFHLERFQAVGRYLGWADGQATVLDADPAALRRLAGAYWVADIVPAERAQ